MKKIWKAIRIPLIIALSLIFCVIGLSKASYSIWDSVYGAIALLAFENTFDREDVNAYVVIARYLALAAAGTTLYVVLDNFKESIKRTMKSMRKDATVIYCDTVEPYVEEMARQMEPCIISMRDENDEVAFYKGPKDQILMFSKDEENLKFYTEHEKELEGKSIYMRLEEIAPFLLKRNSVVFFNTSEMIAADYWKKYPLLKYFERKRYAEVHVGIFGFDNLGEQILRHALMNNVYYKEQRIIYHVWGDTQLFQGLLLGVDLMNQDEIQFHDIHWKEDVERLRSMDRIIICTENLDILQGVLSRCGHVETHFYNPNNSIPKNFYNSDRLMSFGAYSDVYSSKNIKTDIRYRLAKILNYRYDVIFGGSRKNPEQHEPELIPLWEEMSKCVKSSDKESAKEIREKIMATLWEELDGFTKASNIAAADYHFIREKLVQMSGENGTPLTTDELGYGEHLRWSRFHYMNHWRFGNTKDGRKDSQKRIHPCLIPYEELSETNVLKDLENVEYLSKGDDPDALFTLEEEKL